MKIFSVCYSYNNQFNTPSDYLTLQQMLVIYQAYTAVQNLIKTQCLVRLFYFGGYRRLYQFNFFFEQSIGLLPFFSTVTVSNSLLLGEQFQDNDLSCVSAFQLMVHDLPTILVTRLCSSCNSGGNYQRWDWLAFRQRTASSSSPSVCAASLRNLSRALLLLVGNSSSVFRKLC